jgi:single stranded DNA-binding protein (ssb)
MNLVILVGNLTRDPEVRYSTNGTPIATLDLAINRSFTKEGGPDADFLRVTVFGKQAEHAEKYLTKGKKVGVEGRIENNNYENKDGQKVYRDSIIANRIEFLSPKSEGGQSPFSGASESRGPWSNEGAVTGASPKDSPAPLGNEMPSGLSQLDDDDDDLPF